MQIVVLTKNKMKNKWMVICVSVYVRHHTYCSRDRFRPIMTVRIIYAWQAMTSCSSASINRSNSCSASSLVEAMLSLPKSRRRARSIKTTPRCIIDLTDVPELGCLGVAVVNVVNGVGGKPYVNGLLMSLSSVSLEWYDIGKGDAVSVVVIIGIFWC
ncbi:hypothetical protein BDF19DRAFT_286467 [Syncephalis fuscata]|nr:hypothetical protein BDF19DRAFT_286467 [Syncephalis fuscata]